MPFPDKQDSPKRYSKEEARGIFQKSVKNGSVILTREARKRMSERDIDTNDILELGRSGVVFNEPEPHIKTGDWTYRIESQKTNAKAVFVIVSQDRVRLLTVLDG